MLVVRHFVFAQHHEHVGQAAEAWRANREPEHGRRHKKVLGGFGRRLPRDIPGGLSHLAEFGEIFCRTWLVSHDKGWQGPQPAGLYPSPPSPSDTNFFPLDVLNKP